ncbi:hypothetical protein EDC01DRAFT_634678 [Geopyxis carbonaria]|nr:hypothetical protein EDC01DRAFT_634678 [Geopyxis carbonaria]
MNSVEFELSEGEYYLLKFMDPEFNGETSGSTSDDSYSSDEIIFDIDLRSESDSDSGSDSDSDSDSISSFETCTICYEDFPLKTLPTVSSSCAHDPSACKTCLSESLIADQSCKILKFDCPILNCDATLEYADIHRLADKSVFERYDRELSRSFLKTIPNFLFCGASSGCDYGEELQNSATTMSCATCGSVTCVDSKEALQQLKQEMKRREKVQNGLKEMQKVVLDVRELAGENRDAIIWIANIVLQYTAGAV